MIISEKQIMQLMQAVYASWCLDRYINETLIDEMIEISGITN